MVLGRTLAVVSAVLCSAAICAPAQNSATPSVDQRVQQVTSGLVGSVIIKGDAHPGHTLAERMQQLKVPGVSIAVVHDGKIDWARGFGTRDAAGDPVNADTMFQAGSISKPVAALAALHLVEQRKLALDTDINTYLASWKLPSSTFTADKPVTLRTLLTHTAGITVHGFPGYASTEPVPTLVQVLNGEKPANTPAIRSFAAPGSAWQYSGGGFTIMQQAVIDVTHLPFPKVLHDTVLAPIHMTHSTYDQPLPASFTNFAMPEHDEGKPVEGGPHTYPEMAAAGLWTTPSDICRYILEVQQSLEGKANHVLSAAMTRQMVTAGQGHWGLGVEIGGSDANPYFTHGGVNEGYQSLFVAYEKSGEGAAVMTSSDRGMQIAEEVMRSIAATYNWPDWKPEVRTVVQVDAKILADYTGSYAIAPGMDLTISLEDGHLVAQPTGQPKSKLYAESDTKFFPIEIATELEFVRDAQGKVNALVLHREGHERKIPKK